MSRRILLVEPDGHLFSNPTLVGLVAELGRRGVAVDVIAPAALGRDRADAGLRVIPYHHALSREWSWRALPGEALRGLLRGRIGDPRLAVMRRAGRYHAILGVDPGGIAIAHTLNRFARRPLAYLSFELLLSHELETPEEARMKARERAAAQDSQVVLVQDPKRRDLLCADNGLDPAACCLVPVAPEDARPARNDYLRRRFGLGDDTVIVLYQGSLHSWSGRDEFAEMVGYWPDHYRLVVHLRSRPGPRLAGFLKELAGTNRVLISDEPVSAEVLPVLTASADVGLASYRPDPDHWTHGDNLRHIGLASGKLAYYAMCGLPVLGRYLPSLDLLFEAHGFGRSYHRLADTRAILEAMVATRHEMRARSRAFYEHVLSPVDPIKRFCDRLGV